MCFPQKWKLILPLVLLDAEEQISEWRISYLYRKCRTTIKNSNIWCYLHSSNKEGLQTSEKNKMIGLTFEMQL